MREQENIQALLSLAPDYIGFIFFEKSSRYVGKDFSIANANLVPETTKKVGVFVNEDKEKVLALAQKYGLDFLQLHGDESPAYCMELQEAGLQVIKVFSVGESFDFERLVPYQNACAYFLFDTKGKQRGGNGIAFDWKILEQYSLNKPFFLSGGIDVENISALKELKLPQLKALDVNSKFELSPALKDISLLEKLILKIKNQELKPL